MRPTTVLAIVLALGGLAIGGWLAVPRPAPARAAPNHADDPLLGRRAYVHCQACHGVDGRGVPGYAPPLVGSTWLNGDARAAVLIVLHGYDATAEAGAAYVSARMLGHARQLDDAEIAAVLTWARGQWGNRAGAVDPALVARLRLAHADRTTPWTPAELRRLASAP